MRIIILGIFVLFVSSCSGEDEDGQISCTEQLVFGIVVHLYDTSTNERISVCNTTYTINEGEYLEEGSYSDMTQCENTTSIVGAVERSGVYDIEISKIGYENWQLEDITVDADICHVITMNVDAFLVPTS